MTKTRKAAVSSTVGRFVRILATDARAISGILDNELSHGLLLDDAEWELTQLLSSLRAAIKNPNANSATGRKT